MRRVGHDEVVAVAGAAAAAAAAGEPCEARALVVADLFAALESVKPTGVAAAQYRFAQAGAANSFTVAGGAGGAGGAAAGGVVTFGKEVPTYMPSASMRLNTKQLTSQIEAGALPGGPKGALTSLPSGGTGKENGQTAISGL